MQFAASEERIRLYTAEHPLPLPERVKSICLIKKPKGQKKAGSYLLSRGDPSIIGVRELDFRVRNGNGYCLSTMATGILKPELD